jgi:hypothetical protein
VFSVCSVRNVLRFPFPTPETAALAPHLLVSRLFLPKEITIMRKLFPVMLLAALSLAFNQLAEARGGGGGGGPGGGSGSPSFGGPSSTRQAPATSNGRFASDRDTGQDRAKDRMSAQGKAHEKAKAAAKKKEKSAKAATPATSATRATPAVPATSSSPATPAVPATPATPASPATK